MQCEWKNNRDGGETFSPNSHLQRPSNKLQSPQASSRVLNEDKEGNFSTKAKLLTQYLSKISGLKGNKNLEIVPRATARADEVLNKSNLHQLSPRSASSHKMQISGLVGSGFFSTTFKKCGKKNTSHSKKPARKKKSNVQKSTNSLTNVQSSPRIYSSQRLLGSMNPSSDLLNGLKHSQHQKTLLANQALTEIASNSKQLLPGGVNWTQAQTKIKGGMLQLSRSGNRDLKRNVLVNNPNFEATVPQGSDEEYYGLGDESKVPTLPTAPLTVLPSNIGRNTLSSSQEALFLLNSNMLSPIGMQCPNLLQGLTSKNKLTISSPKGQVGDLNMLSARSLIDSAQHGSKVKHQNKLFPEPSIANQLKRNHKLEKSGTSKVQKESQLLASLSEVQLSQFMLKGSTIASLVKGCREKSKLQPSNLTQSTEAFHKKGSAKKVRKTLTLCRSGDLPSEYSSRMLSKTIRLPAHPDKSGFDAHSQGRPIKRARLLSDDLSPPNRQVFPSPRTLPIYMDTSETHNLSASPRKSTWARKGVKQTEASRLDSPRAGQVAKERTEDESGVIGIPAPRFESNWKSRCTQASEVVQSNKNHRSSHSTGSLNAVDDIFRLKEQNMGVGGQSGKLSLLGMKVDRIVREVQKSANRKKGKDSSSRIPDSSNLVQNGSGSKFISNSSGIHKSTLKNPSQTKLIHNQGSRTEPGGSQRQDPMQSGGIFASVNVQKYLQLETYDSKKKKGKQTQNALVKGLLSPRVSATNDTTNFVRNSRKGHHNLAGNLETNRAPDSCPNRGRNEYRQQFSPNQEERNTASKIAKNSSRNRSRMPQTMIVHTAWHDACNSGVDPAVVHPWSLITPNLPDAPMFSQPKGVDPKLGVGYFAETLNQELDAISDDPSRRSLLEVFGITKGKKSPKLGEHRTSRSDIQELEKLRSLFRLNGPNRSQPKIRSKRASAKDSGTIPKHPSQMEVTVKKQKFPACSLLEPIDPPMLKNHKQRVLHSLHTHVYKATPKADNQSESLGFGTPAPTFTSGHPSPKGANNHKHPPAENEADVYWALRNTTLKQRKETVVKVGVSRPNIPAEESGDEEDNAGPFAEPDFPNQKDQLPILSFVPRLLSMGGSKPLIASTPWVTSAMIRMQPSLPVPKDSHNLGSSLQLAKLELLRQKRIRRSLPRRKPEVSEVLGMIASRSRNLSPTPVGVTNQVQESRLRSSDSAFSTMGPNIQPKELSTGQGGIIQRTEEKLTPRSSQQTGLTLKSKQGYLLRSLEDVSRVDKRQLSEAVHESPEGALVTNPGQIQKQRTVTDSQNGGNLLSQTPRTLEGQPSNDDTPRSRLWASLAKLKAMGGQNGLPSSYSKPATLEKLPYQ